MLFTDVLGAGDSTQGIVALREEIYNLVLAGWEV